MKTGYKLFSFVLFACTIAQGQATAQDSFVFLGTAFDDQWSPRSIKVESEATVGSNSINTQMFSDALFGMSFTESAKVKYLEGNQLKTNFYGHSINRVEYKIDSSHAVFVKHKSQIGFKANKDMAELLFWGNAPFEGENVVTENLKFTQANSISAGVSFKHASGEKWKIKGSYGINFITSLREVSANKAELYTARGGSYANVNVESLSISERKDGIKGVGVDIDFEFDYSIDSVNSISMKALDFNFNFLLNQPYLYLDTSFRFNGISYDFVNDSLSITEKIDSSYNDVLNRGRANKKLNSLPTRLSLSWKRKLNPKNDLTLSVHTIDLGVYGVSGRIGLGHKFSNRFKVLSSLGYGNFKGLSWTESLEYQTQKRLNIYLCLQNINAFVAPKSSKSYGLGLGLTKQF